MRVLIICILCMLLLQVHNPPSFQEKEGEYSTLISIRSEHTLLIRLVNNMEYPIRCHVTYDDMLHTVNISDRVEFTVQDKKIPTRICEPLK